VKEDSNLRPIAEMLKQQPTGTNYQQPATYERADPRLKLVVYQWHHRPTSAVGISVVYIEPLQDAQAFLDVWSNKPESRWRYTVLDERYPHGYYPQGYLKTHPNG